MSSYAFDPAHPERGWQPTIPLPFFGRSLFGRRRFVCWAAVPDWPYGVLTKTTCRQRFVTREAYEAHYREAHLDAREVQR